MLFSILMSTRSCYDTLTLHIVSAIAGEATTFVILTLHFAKGQNLGGGDSYAHPIWGVVVGGTHNYRNRLIYKAISHNELGNYIFKLFLPPHEIASLIRSELDLPLKPVL